MLFDLRRRGRRRTVKVIYVGLAGLMAVGLVGFGIGTGGGSGGGIISAFNENSKGGGEPTFEKQIAAAVRQTKKHPSDSAAWKALTEARLHEAGGAEYYDETTETYSPKGKELLALIASSWSEYLTLDPNHPSALLANDVLRIFAKAGLNEPAEAVRALQIIIPSKPPSEALYLDLAEFSYQAKQLGEGELAAKRAEALAPKSSRASLKKELENLKVTEIEKLVKEKNPSVTPTSSTPTTTTPKNLLPTTPSSTTTGSTAAGSTATGSTTTG
jgi:hypothetical protein